MGLYANATTLEYTFRKANRADRSDNNRDCDDN